MSSLDTLQKLVDQPCSGKSEWIAWAVEVRAELTKALPALRAAVHVQEITEEWLAQTPGTAMEGVACIKELGESIQNARLEAL